MNVTRKDPYVTTNNVKSEIVTYGHFKNNPRKEWQNIPVTMFKGLEGTLHSCTDSCLYGKRLSRKRLEGGRHRFLLEEYYLYGQPIPIWASKHL